MLTIWFVLLAPWLPFALMGTGMAFQDTRRILLHIYALDLSSFFGGCLLLQETPATASLATGRAYTARIVRTNGLSSHHFKLNHYRLSDRYIRPSEIVADEEQRLPAHFGDRVAQAIPEIERRLVPPFAIS